VLLPTVPGPEVHPTAAVAHRQEGQEAAHPAVRPTAVPSRLEGPEEVRPHPAAAHRRARPKQAAAAPQSPEAVRPEAAHRSQADRAAAARPTGAVVAAAARRWRFRRPEALPRHL